MISVSDADGRAQLQAPTGVGRQLETLYRDTKSELGVDGAQLEWQFFDVVPAVGLYAPILQLAPGESVHSERVTVWDNMFNGATSVRRRAKGLEHNDFLRHDGKIFRVSDRTSRGVVSMTDVRTGCERKVTLPDDREVEVIDANLAYSSRHQPARCAVYAKYRSFPGSWLLVYWLYYPLDVGGIGSHPHDPEHVFVEVDKLGGRVHQVLASAHDKQTANNLYQVRRGQPRSSVPVPMFALVELDKHATAPDVNGDGRFNLGIDVNNLVDTSTVWGIRDEIGTTDSFLRDYQGWMTIPRNNSEIPVTEDTFRHIMADANPPTAASRILGREQQVKICDLLPFPRIPDEEGFSAGSPPNRQARDFRHAAGPTEHEQEASAGLVRDAIASMRQHVDARTPEAIFKPWLFPQSQLRIAAECRSGDWGLQHSLVQPIEVVVRSLAGLTFMATGIVEGLFRGLKRPTWSVEKLWRSSRLRVPVPGSLRFGARWRRVDRTAEQGGDAWESALEVGYEKFHSSYLASYLALETGGRTQLLRAGLMAEYRELVPKTNLVAEVGVALNKTGGYGVEARLGVALTADFITLAPKRRFGLDYMTCALEIRLFLPTFPAQAKERELLTAEYRGC